MRVVYGILLLLYVLNGANAFTGRAWQSTFSVGGATTRHAGLLFVPRVAARPLSLLYSSNNNDQEEDSFQVFEQLQSQISEAATETIQAEGRVMELERKVQDVLAEIDQKELLLKQGDDAWAKEKVTFAVKVADLTNKLQGKEEDAKERQETLEKENEQRQAQLEQQLQELKGTLKEAVSALEEERKSAEGIRNKLFQAEDNLEFEQMRFQKEKKDLGERIQQEMSKLAKVENQFAQEQDRYQQERQKLENRIKEENTRLSKAEIQLERDSKKFNEDQRELNEKLKEQSQKLDKTEEQLKKDREQYKEETDRLRKLVDDEKRKLRDTEVQLKREEQDFVNAKKDMERRIEDERTKVKNLSNRLKSQAESNENERVALEQQIVQEKAKLAEINEELEAETTKFNREKKRLEEDISYEKRARDVKSRQMADRYESIQKELTNLWQGAKDEARKERNLITAKYDAKLAVVTDNIERLENRLADERQVATDLQQLIDDVAMEKRKILDQQKQEEAVFVRQVAEKNSIITGLTNDVSRLRTELQKRDEIIEEYETNFGFILKQSVRLSRKRIKRSGARLRNFVTGGKREQ